MRDGVTNASKCNNDVTHSTLYLYGAKFFRRSRRPIGTTNSKILGKTYVFTHRHFTVRCNNIFFRITDRVVRNAMGLWAGRSRNQSTGLFISPSGTSELDCATTKTDTAERSISIGRESLKVFFVLGALAYLQVPPLRGSRDEKWRAQ